MTFTQLKNLSVVADAAVPAMLDALLGPEHERVLADVPVRRHVLPARQEAHLAKVVRFCVEQAARAIS